MSAYTQRGYTGTLIFRNNTRMNTSDVVETLNTTTSRLKRAEGHIFDMLLGDDGQAYKEAEKYLEKHRPDLVERLNLEKETNNDI